MKILLPFFLILFIINLPLAMGAAILFIITSLSLPLLTFKNIFLLNIKNNNAKSVISNPLLYIGF